MPDSAPRIIVVDDKMELAETLADGLSDRGFHALALSSSKRALAMIESDPPDALVTDLRMPDLDGIELLAAARRAVPGLPVVVMTAYGAVESAIESIRRGAYHYLTKPFKIEELAVYLERALDEARVRREATELRRRTRAGDARRLLVARSRGMRGVLDVLDRVADADVPVLITGQTGTGKGVVARALHAGSGRSSGPFVTVNCAALPEPLLESELFGHVKGAFTGAIQARTGLFAEANGGTLFLDEIAEMASSLQAKLLDVLERRVVRALGSSKERSVDVRIVTATHQDLPSRVESGAFREDLFYRLNLVTLELPSLRNRREDFPELVEMLFADAKARYPRSPVERLTKSTLAELLDHAWPGNVRELSHTVERMVLLGRGAEASLADLPAALRHDDAPEIQSERISFGRGVMNIRDLQQKYARWALEQLGGHKTRAAEQLGVDIKTLSRWLSEEPTGKL